MKKTDGNIIDEGSYLITPRQFEERMKLIIDDDKTYYDDEQKHKAADRLLVEVLNSLGYGAGTKIFEEMEKWYG